MLRPTGVLALLLLTVLGLAQSEASPAGGQEPAILRSEFLVNSNTEFSQGRADVAADEAGNLVIVWESDPQDGAAGGVFGRRLSPSGAPLGGEFQVNGFTTGAQLAPSVASDAAGNFVVVWASADQDGSGTGVFGQRFAAAGVAVGDEFQVNTVITGNQDSPKVAMSSFGSFIVVWESEGQDGSLGGVFGQRFDAAGAPAGAEFQVNSFTTGWQTMGEISAGPAGDFIVVWASEEQDGSGSGVFGQRFEASGAPLGSEFPINTATAGDQYFPTVALAGSGDFIVGWSSPVGVGTAKQILAQRFGSNGLAIGDEIEISQSPENDHLGASVAVDNQGHFLVVWTAFLPNQIPLEDAPTHAFGRMFDAAANPLGDEFRMNESSSYVMNPKAVASGPQRFAAAWHSLGVWHHLVPLDVFAKIYAPPLFSDGFGSESICGWSAAVGSGDSCP